MGQAPWRVLERCLHARLEQVFLTLREGLGEESCVTRLRGLCHARPGCTHLYQLVSVIMMCREASTRQKWKKE